MPGFLGWAGSALSFSTLQWRGSGSATGRRRSRQRCSRQCHPRSLGVNTMAFFYDQKLISNKLLLNWKFNQIDNIRTYVHQICTLDVIVLPPWAVYRHVEFQSLSRDVPYKAIHQKEGQDLKIHLLWNHSYKGTGQRNDFKEIFISVCSGNPFSVVMSYIRRQIT